MQGPGAQGSELLAEPKTWTDAEHRHAGGVAVRQHRLHSETAAGALVTATVSASENLAVGHRWASDGCSILASLLLPIDGTVAGTCAA